MPDFLDRELLPDMQQGEEVQALAGTDKGDMTKSTLYVCVTNRRVLVFQTRPNRMDNQVEEELSLPLESIHAVHEHDEDMQKRITLEAANGTYTLPEIYAKNSDLVETIVRQTGLVRRKHLEQDDDITVTGFLRNIGSIFGLSGALVSIWMGVAVIALGVMFALSGVGMFIGVPFYFLGVAMIGWGIEKLVEGNNREETEKHWVRQ